VDEIVERRTNLVHLGLCIDVEINNYLALDVTLASPWKDFSLEISGRGNEMLGEEHLKCKSKDVQATELLLIVIFPFEN